MSPHLPHVISFQAGLWSGEYGVEFRLVYNGPLKSKGTTEDKHAIRRQLHSQLRELWDQHSGLRRLSEPDRPPGARHKKEPQSTTLNQKGDAYNLLYLIGEGHGISCELDILFLRRESPGGLFAYSGDLDNRMKTLFDALKVPTQKSELPDFPAAPDEDPFFCLLQDDKYVERFSITTDRLLVPPNSDTQKEKGSVLLVIAVKTILVDIRKADWWQGIR